MKNRSRDKGIGKISKDLILVENMFPKDRGDLIRGKRRFLGGGGGDDPHLNGSSKEPGTKKRSLNKSRVGFLGGVLSKRV